MTERSRPWDGTTLGDATEAPYDAATEFAAILMYISGAGAFTHAGGIFRHPGSAHLNLSGTASPITIGTGRALVHGTWYEADANVSVTVPTPSGAARQDRIVLRKSWAAQTVRVTRIAGAEGGGPPALVQTPGTTYDMPLYIISTTTGGVVSIVGDERVYLGSAESAFNSVGGLVAGDMMYAVDALRMGRLPIGGANGVLASVAGVPNWTASPTLTALTVTTTIAATGVVTGSRFSSSIATGTAPYSANSTTLNTNLNADLVDGFHASASILASNVVARDGSGYIQASFINMTAGAGGATPALVAGQHGGDNYIRWYSPANLVAFLLSADGAGSGLDADLVDGLSAANLLARANHTGTQAPSTISPQGAASGLDADTVDGYHANSLRSYGEEYRATNATVLSTSWVAMLGTTNNVTETAKWLVIGVFDFACVGADNGQLFQGRLMNTSLGSEVGGQRAIFQPMTTGDRATVVQTWVADFTGGHAVQLQVTKSGGSGTSEALASHTAATWIKLSPN